MSRARPAAIAFRGGSIVLACAGASFAQALQEVGAARVNNGADALARAVQRAVQ